MSSRATGACRRRPPTTTDFWFKAGDVGKIDKEGYVTIIGRSKEFIINGGNHVYPAEVEGYIKDLPGVAESAFVGVPHPDFGEAVVAVLVPRVQVTLDGSAIVAELKRQIANFKMPKRLVVMSEPPTRMGKVQKNCCASSMARCSRRD